MNTQNFLKNTKMPVMALLLASSLPLPAFADNGDGFKLAFNLFFGKESERSESRSCSNMDSGGGGSALQGVNAFFCQMEKRFGITQAPTSANAVSVTKVYGGRSVHVEIVGQAGTAGQVAAGYNDDGTANPSMGYDYLAKVWVCKSSGSVTCTSVTDFKPAIAIAYSYKTDGTINKGNLLQDPSARDGLGGGAAMSLVYNTSSTSANKRIVVKHLVQNGDRLRIDGTVAKATSVMSVQLIHDQSSAARRFSAKVDISMNTASAAFAQGVALSDSSTAADPVQCFNRNNDGIGDWSYSLNPTATCSVDAYTDSVSTVSVYSFNNILKTAPTDTNWSNGMPPNPVAL